MRVDPLIRALEMLELKEDLAWSDGMRVDPLIRACVRHLARRPADSHGDPLIRACLEVYLR